MNPAPSKFSNNDMLKLRVSSTFFPIGLNWIFIFLMLSGLGCFHGASELMRLQFNNGISLKIQIQKNTTYQLQWSNDLKTWHWLGDTFLPDPSQTVNLPKSAQGFIRFVPRFKVPDKDLKVVIIGDSTVADLSFLGDKWNGWGQWIQTFFLDKAVFINQAEPGMSTTRFITENRIAYSDRITPDIVILQFGMVDKIDGIFPDVYEKNLSVIVDFVREIGAIPVVVTPVAGRTFDETGEYINELADYAEAAIRIAESKFSALVDLNKSSAEFYKNHGFDQTVMMTGCGNTCPDRIHFSKAGSHIMAAVGIQDFPQLLKTYTVPLQYTENAILSAFANDKRFAGLQTPFVELTGFQENQVWDWVFPEGF